MVKLDLSLDSNSQSRWNPREGTCSRSASCLTLPGFLELCAFLSSLSLSSSAAIKLITAVGKIERRTIKIWLHVVKEIITLNSKELCVLQPPFFIMQWIVNQTFVSEIFCILFPLISVTEHRKLPFKSRRFSVTDTSVKSTLHALSYEGAYNWVVHVLCLHLVAVQWDRKHDLKPSPPSGLIVPESPWSQRVLCVDSDWTHNEPSWWESSFSRMTSAESSRSFINFIREGGPFVCDLFWNRYTIKRGIIRPGGNHFIYRGHVEPPSPLIARWSVCLSN